MEAWGAERHSAPFLCLKNLFQQRDKTAAAFLYYSTLLPNQLSFGRRMI